jgi:hypothetical protein
MKARRGWLLSLLAATGFAWAIGASSLQAQTIDK